LVRCSVPGRDYSQLGIGDHAGSGGTSGLDGEDVLLGSAGAGGADGLADAGGLGGSGGAPPPPPIPCVVVGNDAGSEDAGSTDAGSTDAGSTDAGSTDAGNPDAGRLDEFCACVDGFIQAVDADRDGDGTRACSLAPGLDCDDSDPAVTHNSCGGCGVLPNAVGEDCLDCGAYICGGPDALVCATKPDAVIVDPDCRCSSGLVVARDTDGDGAGTRLCEFNPGIDCNDGDNSYTTNECGGCAELPAAVGAGCNECGVYSCIGTALACVPNPATPTQCLTSVTRQSCINDGFWGSNRSCDNGCYYNDCAVCTPGTFRCTFNAAGDGIEACFDSVSYGINWWPASSGCGGATPRCNPVDGSCHSYLLLPRDRTLDLVPSQREGLPWHHLLNTALDSDYG
jgi:hypothetical protein